MQLLKATQTNSVTSVNQLDRKEQVMMLNKPINEIIDQVIKDRDVSLEQIAGEISVSSMTVYRWRRGQTIPKSRIVLRALTEYINNTPKG